MDWLNMIPNNKHYFYPDIRRCLVNKQLKIKQILLAGIIALSLFLGGLGVANRIQAATNSSVQIAADGFDKKPNGACWKCLD